MKCHANLEPGVVVRRIRVCDIALRFLYREPYRALGRRKQRVDLCIRLRKRQRLFISLRLPPAALCAFHELISHRFEKLAIDQRERPRRRLFQTKPQGAVPAVRLPRPGMDGVGYELLPSPEDLKPRLAVAFPEKCGRLLMKPRLRPDRDQEFWRPANAPQHLAPWVQLLLDPPGELVRHPLVLDIKVEAVDRDIPVACDAAEDSDAGAHFRKRPAGVGRKRVFFPTVAYWPLCPRRDRADRITQSGKSRALLSDE